MRAVISYDISDTKRRNKIAKALEGYGYRGQYSVFECEVDARQLLKLQRALRPLVRGALQESARFHPLPANAAERMSVIGKNMARLLGLVEVVG
jgi:CRISPR-associated protein Cas2